MTQITDALVEKLEAEVKAIEANLYIYLNSPSSQVAEHIDYVGTVEKQLEKLSSQYFLPLQRWELLLQVPWIGMLVLQVNTYGVECRKEMGLRYLED